MPKPSRKPRQPASGDAVGPTPEILAKFNIVLAEPPKYSREPAQIRKEGLHTTLNRAGRITNAQWGWAERYVNEFSVVYGESGSSWYIERLDPEHTEPVYDKKTRASAFLARADKMLGELARQIIIFACVECFRYGVIAHVCLGIPPNDDETMNAFDDRVKRRVFKAVVEAIEEGSGIKEREGVEEKVLR